MDLDGVDIELARHLIDLHWNRQHYAYLLTYRPAVMQSLADGGRWCNKLLLNAMYYTSSLYSDRECLRSTPQDTQSAGDRFYQRFRELLVDEIVRPSIPTTAALLLTGAALVSQGRSSAGWTLCGTAYRMIIDMGCHLTVDVQPQGSNQDIDLDIEFEWRRRLYWGAFLTDATQSLYLGRQMTMRPSEARVPQLFLDTYEELEEWVPYVDPSQPVKSQSVLLSFRGKPAYAVSVFESLIKLSQKTERITQTFYSINCVKRTKSDAAKIKMEIEQDLSGWLSGLPEHLRFDPASAEVPPPHQITPHTTYHTLNILLQRPFIDGGYLQDRVSPELRHANEEKCVESALAIWKLVDAYRTGLTLRRAPFLLSYAVYSAVVVILRQSRKEQQRGAEKRASAGPADSATRPQAKADKFREPINFFWTALSELQRGCNFGLKKPVSIIREMMNELGNVTPTGGAEVESGSSSLFAKMLEMYSEPHLSKHSSQQLEFRDTNRPVSGNEEQAVTDQFAESQFVPNSNDQLALPFDPTPPGFLDFLDDTEQTITNDTLYGLFAQDASWF
ncbi:fungal-specific transcription factor domain-containing protein [Microdochium trichocladiopsis]|uniref:Fungal-specific transcription factor domain-containing protein n=1 Tax=Microdochium trichocladiopsis TaxID=1682393 RepID=A0A9P8Y5C7_9PEZI|nr:fungal-specific transcription factor domain-containing protein [Microdochium trichocladiopsis]KAH7030579.1 fungal-specific transcription factor domain-containing protein [Microdochium trichocladiopsis]